MFRFASVRSAQFRLVFFQVSPEIGKDESFWRWLTDYIFWSHNKNMYDMQIAWHKRNVIISCISFHTHAYCAGQHVITYLFKYTLMDLDIGRVLRYAWKCGSWLEAFQDAYGFSFAESKITASIWRRKIPPHLMLFCFVVLLTNSGLRLIVRAVWLGRTVVRAGTFSFSVHIVDIDIFLL